MGSMTKGYQKQIKALKMSINLDGKNDERIQAIYNGFLFMSKEFDKLWELHKDLLNKLEAIKPTKREVK